jgi:adenylate cyclase
MKKKLVEGSLIGVLAAFAALVMWHAGILDRLELDTWDWREQVFASPSRATCAIKLILLDQQSLDWGQKENHLSWPWPREVYAPIIDFCTRHGARAIIFDVIYSEPSAYGVADDQALASAISGAPLFVASMCLHTEKNFSTDWPAHFPDRFLLDIANLKDSIGSPSEGKFTRNSATFPIEEVALNSTVLANVMDDPDIDGVFRRANLFRVFNGKPVPSIGFAAFTTQCVSHARERSSRSLPQECSGSIEADRLRILDANIPIDHEGRLILRFRGPSGVFKFYSADEVIQSEINSKAGLKETIDGESFKDCYVFFGFSAPGLVDLKPTPLSSHSPGLEIHATLLDNLLAGDFLRDTPPAAVVLSVLLLALLASISMLLFVQGFWHCVLWTALLAPLPVVIGFGAYPLGFWQPIVIPESALLAALGGSIVLNYSKEVRKKTFIKKAFKHYLSPEVIELILENPSHLKLGGERKELSILFSDIEGFSTISEKLDPESLTRLLNTVLSDMTDIILDEGGTLDKYEGDAIIAFWNAPIDQPDHAERACRAALRCQQKMRDRQEEYRKMAGSPLRMRIGIHTGDVVVGNMGSARRFDYTVIGDAANLASRLEGANKLLGTGIIVSSQTWTKTSGQFAGRLLGVIQVVGRGTPVRVFEPTGLQTNADERDERFDQALSCCLGKKWHEALDLFDNLPEDPVSQVYAKRCRELIEHPGRDWDGIWRLDQK